MRVNDAYNQFFREVFLSELMRHHSGWVLKGGSNIYCRIPGARQTRDLDLYRHHDPTSAHNAAQSLLQSMHGHRVGPYTFQVQHPRKGSPAGTIDSERVDVQVMYGVGSTLLAFSVDVSGDLQVEQNVDPIAAQRTFDVETDFLPASFTVFSYPVANQVADKICAMYERHGTTPPGIASTRYHDLYDVALIASELMLQASELNEALTTQCQVRSLELPEALISPGEKWPTGYAKTTKNTGGIKDKLADFDEALRIAALLVDPVLPGNLIVPEKQWDPRSLTWR